jgi:hypothetical protein
MQRRRVPKVGAPANASTPLKYATPGPVYTGAQLAFLAIVKSPVSPATPARMQGGGAERRVRNGRWRGRSRGTYELAAAEQPVRHKLARAHGDGLLAHGGGLCSWPGRGGRQAAAGERGARREGRR